MTKGRGAVRLLVWNLVFGTPEAHWTPSDWVEGRTWLCCKSVGARHGGGVCVPYLHRLSGAPFSLKGGFSVVVHMSLIHELRTTYWYVSIKSR